MQSSKRTLFLSHEPGLLLSGCVLQGCAGPSEGDDIVQSDSLHVTSKPGGRLDAHALCTRPNPHPPRCLSLLSISSPALHPIDAPTSAAPSAVAPPHRTCPPHSLPRGPHHTVHSILLGTPWEPPANITLILHRALTPAPCHHRGQGPWAYPASYNHRPTCSRC